MKILAFDIETRPIKAYTWGLFDQNVSIGQIIEPASMLCFAARWVGSKKVLFHSVHHDGKQAMLDQLHGLMDEADYVMSWNGKNFDSKWVRTEFVLNGMSPPSPVKDLDLLLLARRQFRMTSNKLDWVASVMGVAGKVKHDGFQLWIDCMAGDEAAWKKMRTYNKRDVDILVEIYEKLLPWMGSDSPNMAIASGRPNACIVCAGENLSPRGRAYTTTGSYARYRCDDCFKWQKSKSSLATSNMRNI